MLNPLYANVNAVIGAVKWDMLKPLALTVDGWKTLYLTPAEQLFDQAA